MAQMEYKVEAIGPAKIHELGITTEEDKQLRSALRAFTQGEPRAFMNTAIDRGDGCLEVWRTLVSLYDPDNDTTRLDEPTFIMSPGGKAKSLGDVQGILSRWEDAINHRTKTLGKSPLDDDLKRSVLLKILPDTEEKELRNQIILYKSFDALRVRILEIINERSKGPAPMLFNCDEDTLGEADDEGEWLMRIENRSGQRLRTWTKVPTKGGGKGGKSLECFRCGRTPWPHSRRLQGKEAHERGRAQRIQETWPD